MTPLGRPRLHLALDTDVFARDPWLKGQEFRVLVNYLTRTRSKLLLLEPVFTELQEKMKRDFTKYAEDITSAIRRAERTNLHLVPQFDSTASIEQTVEDWEKNFNMAFLEASVETVALNTSVLGEAIRRATARLAPCKANGEGMRDAIIWLNLLEHAKSLDASDQIAFVTNNSEDYAGADKTALRPELDADFATLQCGRLFFVSLGAFNKSYSNHIQHITPSWAIDKGVVASITSALSEYFTRFDVSHYFRVVNSDYADFYEPAEIEIVHSADIEINDVTVWKFTEGHSELRIEFAVDIEADVLCDLMYRPVHSWARSSHEDLVDEYPIRRTLTCYAQLLGSIGASSDGDALTIGALEELERR